MRIDHLIAGKSVAGKDYFETVNPATQGVLAEVASGGEAEVNAAVAAAKEAFPKWAGLPAPERAKLIRKLGDLIAKNVPEIAQTETNDCGQTISQTGKQLVPRAADNFYYFAEMCTRVDGHTYPTPTHLNYTLFHPVGVCALISPWNVPFMTATWKVAPCLAFGNTAVLKMSELSPLTAARLGELALEAGIPPGVLNVITGTDSAAYGKVLCDSDTVRHLSFTGSTEVGRILMAQCASTIKKLGLELGGNAPFIVFDDADLDAAVEGAIASKYRNAGQTCVCANRLYAQDGIYDKFVKKLAAKVSKMKVGNGFDEGVAIGPLIEDAAVKKVGKHVADAVKKGGKLLTGGEKLKGQFYQPTVIADATADMLVATEETFGPLAPVFRFKTEAEAIAAANATIFGLASYFFARDIGRVTRVSEALEYGIVGINTGIVSVEQAPFGGVKQSGLGREGSRHGIDEYLEMKYLCLGDVHQ